MKRLGNIAALLVGACIGWLVVRVWASDPAQSSISAKTLKVRPYVAVDGDTFITAGDQTVYRLYGVDAPEHDQPWGDVAQAVLKQLTQRRAITIQSTHGSSYGRPVVTATVRGQDIGLLLLQMGLAWHDARFAPERSDYAEAEKAARKLRLGLWSENKPVAPWEWRANRKYKIVDEEEPLATE